MVEGASAGRRGRGEGKGRCTNSQVLSRLMISRSLAFASSVSFPERADLRWRLRSVATLIPIPRRSHCSRKMKATRQMAGGTQDKQGSGLSD